MSRKLSAIHAGRNSIGIDIDPEYCRMALLRLDTESGPLFAQTAIEYRTAADLLARENVPAVADKLLGSSRRRRYRRQGTDTHRAKQSRVTP